jgi:hypothetical protein
VIARALAGALVGHVALMLLYELPADGWDGVTLAAYALGAIGGGLTALIRPRRPE